MMPVIRFSAEQSRDTAQKHFKEDIDRLLDSIHEVINVTAMNGGSTIVFKLRDEQELTVINAIVKHLSEYAYNVYPERFKSGDMFDGEQLNAPLVTLSISWTDFVSPDF